MMKTDEFGTLIESIGLSRERAARLLSVGRDELNLWADGKKTVPDQVALIIRMMAAKRISPDEAMSYKSKQAAVGATAGRVARRRL